jgi:hypothetical protein
VRPGLDSRQGSGFFLFSIASRQALDPSQPLIPCVPEALFLGIRRPQREADYSPPSSAEVKKARSYTSTSPYVLMA